MVGFYKQDAGSQQADVDTLSVLRLYLREVNFTTPEPEMREQAAQQQSHLTIGLRVVTRADSYEVQLNTVMHCQHDHHRLYQLSIEFGAVVRIDSRLEELEKKRLLLVDVAEMIFPFNRTRTVQIIAEAGLPVPPYFPIDFQSLFEQNKDSFSFDHQQVLN